MTATEYSMSELFAVLLARDFRMSDRTFKIGANFPVARAATLFAALTRRSEMHVMLGLGWHVFDGTTTPPPVYPYTFDPRTLRADAWMWPWTGSDDMHGPDVFFISGLQVDQRGNVNLFGIRGSDGTWKVRGPGGVGLASATSHAGGYYIVMPHHDPRTFVERVDLITAVGDVERRRHYRLPGGGPRLVLSPLGVFDFDEVGDMRIRSLHQGITLDNVNSATGFTIRCAGEPPVTVPPTDSELEILRERVDIEKLLVDRVRA